MGRLLTDHADDNALVAFGELGDKRCADLVRDAADIAAGLPAPSQGSHIVLVFERDRYLFAAALLGAWSAGHSVALPPNTRRVAVWEVADRDECIAILHDTDSGSPVRIDALLGTGIGDPSSFRAGPRDTGTIATVFTSGSTGATQGWPKTGAQLLGEAEVLADHFGLHGARVAATVPPGHIYGLLFSVLVPLVAGGAFLRETPFHAESVAEAARRHRADILVTVPAHLRALSQVDGDGFTGIRRVFSSTAPLGGRIATRFRKQHGLGITEVFGSSETGGIASRDQGVTPDWGPLPGVSVDASSDGRLLVDSPFTDHSLPRPYQTSDLAELNADGTFAHRGRVDGVVKVGGRRVSLGAIERVMLGLEGVEDATVLAVDDDSGRGSQLLAAIVATGWNAGTLKDALSDRFDRSTLPRRILFVDELPREGSGKLQRKTVLRLFGRSASGAPIEWAIAWEALTMAETNEGFEASANARVPETYGWYEGHFPGYPILAGAVQLHEVVLPKVRECRSDLGDLRTVTRLKFLDRIKPGDAIRLEIRWSSGSDDVDFRIAREATTCASGRLSFGDAQT